MISIHELLARAPSINDFSRPGCKGWLLPHLGTEPLFTDLDLPRERAFALLEV